MDELAGEFAGKVKVGKLNIRQAPDTAERYQIEAIPTLVLFKNGQEIKRISGVPTKAFLTKWLGQGQGGP